MGLTVHYEFEFNGEKKDLEEKLENLRKKFTDLPVQKVYDIVRINKCSQEFGYGKYDDNRYYQNELGFALQYAFEGLKKKRSKLTKIISDIGGTINLHELSEEDYLNYKELDDEIKSADKALSAKIITSGNGYVLLVDVAEGCEFFGIRIGRLGNSKKWRGWDFTKTQYAENFLQSHLTVIEMLDLCKASSILKRVHDEGKYWETRDLKVLSKEINMSTYMLKAFVNALKGVVEKPLEVKSKIDKCENYLIIDDNPDSKNRLKE